jgi:rhamnulokinase
LLLQECQRHWARNGHSTDYKTLLADVDAVPPFTALIDPDDSRFLAPQDMPAAINAYLQEHGQMPLTAPAAFARCIMESLVLRYRQVFDQICRLAGTSISGVHILGGGARNARLNQWLADALDMPVMAGPYEATALGNALINWWAWANCAVLSRCVPLLRARPHGSSRRGRRNSLTGTRLRNDSA